MMMYIGVAVLVVLLLVYMYYPRGPYQQDVVGNNGTMDCQRYCATNWGNELPAEWNGAKCVQANQPGGDCNVSAVSVNGGVIQQTICKCESTGTGWANKENFGFSTGFQRW